MDLCEIARTRGSSCARAQRLSAPTASSTSRRVGGGRRRPPAAPQPPRLRRRRRAARRCCSCLTSWRCPGRTTRARAGPPTRSRATGAAAAGTERRRSRATASIVGESSVPGEKNCAGSTAGERPLLTLGRAGRIVVAEGVAPRSRRSSDVGATARSGHRRGSRGARALHVALPGGGTSAARAAGGARRLARHVKRRRAAREEVDAPRLHGSPQALPDRRDWSSFLGPPSVAHHRAHTGLT